MTRIWIALAAFLVTISIVWVVSSPDMPTAVDPSSVPAQPAQIYLQSGTKLNGSPKASASPMPTETPTPEPTATILTPQEFITPSPTRSPMPTPTVLMPLPTQAPTQTPTPTPSPTPIPTPTPTAPAMSLTLLALTSPVAQKQDATVKIQTTPTAECTIEVTLPSGSVSTSKDLGPKTADENGIAEWSWGINWNTKTGTATIKLSCATDGATATGQTTMEIVSSQ